MRLRKASRRVTQIYDHGLEAAGLTVSQYGVLGQLRRYDGIGISALAEILIMDPTTLTRSLRPLERQGLVTMKPGRRDRRSRCLHLTAKRSAVLRRRSEGPRPPLSTPHSITLSRDWRNREDACQLPVYAVNERAEPGACTCLL
jgi:DNA-binding MarR family transcriptional regulator